MNRTLRFVKNILAEILNYLLFFAAGTVLLTDFAGSRQVWAGLWIMGLLPVFYYFVRKYCRRFAAFFLLHILPAALFLTFYQGDLIRKIWIVFVMALFIGISFDKKIHGGEMGINVITPVVFGGFIWVMYLIDQKRGGVCAGFLLYVSVVFLTGYLGYYFLGQFTHYIEMNNRTTENIPVGHVFWSSAVLAGVFSVFAGSVVILGADKELLDRIGAFIHRIVIRVLGYLMSFFPKGGEEGEVIEEILPDSGRPAMPWEKIETAEPFWLLEILEKLLGVIVMAALAVLLIWTIVRIVRFIREVFAGKRTDLEIVEQSSEDLVEKLSRHEKKAGEKEKTALWEKAKKAISPEERIRRIYKKEVERKLAVFENKEELAASETPREWCLKLFPEKEAALEFALLYEKARYGFRACGGEDVKRARKLAQEFHR